MNIPIVFTINNSYIKQLSTVLISILDNRNKFDNYEFIVMSSDLQEKNKNILINWISEFDNAKIRFINMEEKINSKLEKYMAKRDGYTYITPETYYRFYIPELLKDYEKILYLDCDILVFEDVATLYKESIENYYCAAVLDEYYISQIKNNQFVEQHPNMTFKEYTEQILKIQDEKYFNAGIILLNIKQILKDGIVEKLWQFAEQNSPLQYQDQDVLNSVFNKKVKYVDYTWNLIKQIKYQEKPRIVHYAGPLKPWMYAENGYGFSYVKAWWREYLKTPFVENDDKILMDKIFKNVKEISFLHKIFSVKNEGNYKVVRILGLVIPFKR